MRCVECRSVAGAGPVEVGKHISRTLPQRPS